MFTVYDVEFKTKADFYRALGYKAPLSPALIVRQYEGKYENLVKSRLKADTDDQAREMLQALIDKSKNIDYVKECYKVAWDMLDVEHKNIIAQSIASVHSLDASELKKKIGL
nr:MAG TPA: hypothetical protein [Caudoviricetes sp.]